MSFWSSDSLESSGGENVNIAKCWQARWAAWQFPCASQHWEYQCVRGTKKKSSLWFWLSGQGTAERKKPQWTGKWTRDRQVTTHKKPEARNCHKKQLQHTDTCIGKIPVSAGQDFVTNSWWTQHPCAEEAPALDGLKDYRKIKEGKWLLQ